MPIGGLPVALQFRNLSSRLNVRTDNRETLRENSPMKQIDGWWRPFREAKFRHDCVNIELTKNDSNAVTYQGPGEVWQNEDGYLSFKCICQDKQGTAIKYILHDTALEVGKLIPDSA